MLEELSPGSIDFTVTIFKILQISKHLSAMPFGTQNTHQIVAPTVEMSFCVCSSLTASSHLTISMHGMYAKCKIQRNNYQCEQRGEPFADMKRRQYL